MYYFIYYIYLSTIINDIPSSFNTRRKIDVQAHTKYTYVYRQRKRPDILVTRQ